LGIAPSRVQLASVYPGSTIAVFTITGVDSIAYNATIEAADVNSLVMQVGSTKADVLSERLGMPVVAIDHIVWASSTASPYTPPTTTVTVSVALIVTISVVGTLALIGLLFAQYKIYRYFATRLAVQKRDAILKKQKDSANKDAKEGDAFGGGSKSFAPEDSIQMEVQHIQEQKRLDKVRRAQQDVGIHDMVLAPVEQVYAATRVDIENENEYFGITGGNGAKYKKNTTGIDTGKLLKKVLLEKYEQDDMAPPEDEDSSAESMGDGDVWSSKRMESHKLRGHRNPGASRRKRRQSSVQPLQAASANSSPPMHGAGAGVRSGAMNLLQLQAAQLMSTTDYIAKSSNIHPSLALPSPGGGGGSIGGGGSPSALAGGGHSAAFAGKKAKSPVHVLSLGSPSNFPLGPSSASTTPSNNGTRFQHMKAPNLFGASQSANSPSNSLSNVNAPGSASAGPPQSQSS